VSDPIVLHVIRPYASPEEYLRNEAWTMDARTMLLIGEADLPPGTQVTFDVTLGDGSRPIRAEARVLANVEPSGSRPGGVRVRFKRYGASTETFIDKAVEMADRASLRPAPRATPAPPKAASVPPPRDPSEHPPSPAAAATTALSPMLAGQGAEGLRAALEALRTRAAGVGELGAPSERELLLERLRQRGQSEDVTTRFRV
jgi:xanthine/CO dehydrogenase XdhC/CoxF family maturation factor